MRKTTCLIAPRSEPAGLVAAAARAMAAPALAVSPRLAAASTAAPPVASAAVRRVRRSKRGVWAVTWASLHGPVSPDVLSRRRSDELGVVVAHVADARSDPMVGH